MYEASARVPLIVAGPGIPKGEIREQLVSLLDLYPTLCDLAGLPKPGFLSGYSLAPLLFGEKDNNRPDFVTSQYHSTFSTTGSFMVRQGQWKLVLFGGNQTLFPPQLFNLEADSHEVHNLAGEQPQVVRDLTALLDSSFDWQSVDSEAKRFQRGFYRDHVAPTFNRSQTCTGFMKANVFTDFDAKDAQKLGDWSGVRCN